MYRITTATAVSVLAAGAFFVAAPVAHGDATTPQTAQQTQQAPQANFSDEQLQSFAAAANEVRTVHEEWQQRLQETQDPRQQQQIRQEASQEMAEAIEDEGLTIEEYNEISQVARQDPEVYDKVSRYMQEAQ